MGLDISHGCFSGSYATFDHLRVVWAQAAGYGVQDFGDLGGPLVPNLDFDAYSEADMAGEWPEGAPDDPLVIVLIHEEDGGRIKRDHCPFLADRLAQLESVMIKDPAQLQWLLLTQQFILGLRTAAHYGQDVIFS